MRVEIFSFQPIDSRMYLIMENDQALIVDPCVDGRALALLDAMGIRQLTILLTHEHYDHISGVNRMKQYGPCKVICSGACAARLTDDKKNLSRYFDVLMTGRHGQAAQQTRPYTCEATDTFEGQCVFRWQGHTLKMRETPGHSPGSICMIMDGEILFTGDTLLKEDEIITKLPGGNRRKYEEVTKPWLMGLSGNLHVYPGHGEDGQLKTFRLWRSG